MARFTSLETVSRLVMAAILGEFILDQCFINSLANFQLLLIKWPCGVHSDSMS